MASTYSALKIELIGTGEQSGTWGTTTNNNLGNDALGEAITGSADVSFSSADVTVTLTDVNTTQTARNLRLNLTGTSGGARNLILGSGCQIEKLYLVNNTCADTVTVKNTSGTGIEVPAGKATLVYNNGTNVVDVVNSFSSAILGAVNAGSVIPFYFANQAAFPSASTYHGAIAHSHSDGAMYFAHGGYWIRITNDGGPLGTPSSGTATNLTGLPLSTGVTGTLPIANGGTGTTSTTFTNLTTNVTGTLPVANGGTGAATLAGANIAVLTSTQTFTAAQRGTITVLTDGATVTPDFAVTNNYSLTLGGNRTLANPTNLTAGQSGSIFLVQDGTGSRTLAFGSYYDFINGTAPTLSTTASAVDRLDYVVRSATSIHAVFTANYS